MPFFKNHIPSGHRPAIEGREGGAHSSSRRLSIRENTTTQDETTHAHADGRDPRSTKGQLIRDLVRRGTRKVHSIADANKRGHDNDDKVAAGGTASNAKEQKNAAGEVNTTSVTVSVQKLIYLCIF